jgi:DNA-binding CsgD family transcriptional regulator/tetratricopeptide (TPR) repeat protein
VPGDPAAAIPDRASHRSAVPKRPQARTPFIGRAVELQQLKVAFDDAADGQGSLIMLVGEPGIGKTALCEQFCRFVLESDGRPLVGHCYEAGSFRPPYQPFVEVFGTYLQQCDIATLAVDLGSGAVELARIMPMLCERLNLSARPPVDPEEDRWRLLQAATDFLRSIAAQRPLLLVLEDLHDADRGTLDLLLYLARSLHGARMLVLGTYRDVEVDRAHPLAAALTELHRATNVARVQLRGLSTDEVQRLLTETSQQTIPQSFAELVHRQTEGNPLFVHETLRYVIEAGVVERRDGALLRVGDPSLAGRIPEGLRDVVGKRLSRLSESTNRVLSVASVIGREFQLAVLERVLGSPEEEVERALDEARAAAILEERSVLGTSITYGFSHAFIQQTLYDEVLAPRRIRLHQQLARALEEVHARRLEEHAAELAEHYAFSSDPFDLAKAVRYGELAARRASDVFAYGEAARLLERASMVQELAEPEDKVKRCDLLLALGDALVAAGEPGRVSARVAPDALALAEIVGDRSRMFRACKLALESLDAQGAATSTRRPDYLQLAEQARGYANANSIDRVHADLALAAAWDSRGRRQEARALRLEALALSRQLGDPEALIRSGFFLILTGAPQHLDERLDLAEEAVAWPRQGVGTAILGSLLWYSAKALLAHGERARAEEVWRQMQELPGHTHLATVSLNVSRRDMVLAIVDGRLEDVLGSQRGFVERADAAGAAVMSRQFALQMLLAPSVYLGRAEAWLAAFDEFAQLAGPATEAVELSLPRAICLAHVARLEEARALVGARLEHVGRNPDADETPARVLYWLLEVAVVLGEHRAARALSERLACVAHLSITEGDTYTCPARHLGDAAVLLGDRITARAYYVQALEAAGKIRFRPELALTHLRLAELLGEDEQDAARSEARTHLDVAIAELQDMHMQPALERAMVVRNKLQTSPQDLAARHAGLDALTGRERQIAGLMASGLTNREIAAELIISEGTVEVHVKHILGKLGFKSRSEVAGWFARQSDSRQTT